MTEYPYRLASAFLGSEIWPAFVRNWLMRSLGMKVGPKTAVWSNCRFCSSRVTLGSNVFINRGFFFDGADDLVIGDNVRIGPFVTVLTASHNIGPSSQRCIKAAVTKPITIEAGCWIGAQVTIMPGCIVKAGCVIGAGSLLTTSTEPDGIYVGRPARRVKDLSPTGEINHVPNTDAGAMVSSASGATVEMLV